MSNMILQASGLHKSYQLGRVSLRVLKGVSLSVQRGEFVAIMGSSGSGKSTLLHLMGALDIPDRGTMSNLECHSCHQPHGDIRPTEAACVACHANQDSIGRHDRHVGISCLKCHHAHTWRVGPELARELCVECHDYRDPMGFIF